MGPMPTDITTSEELIATLPGGIELCHQTFGDPEDEPLLLMMGLGGAMNWWDDALCERFAAAGFHVIRYDQRDTGRSTWVEGTGAGLSDLVRAAVGLQVDPPYGLVDLAADAIGLLDHLDIDRAHLVGISMGGMVAQTAALAQPDRVRSLTSIMSTTGRRTVGWTDPRLIPRLLRGPARTEEDYVEAMVAFQRLLASPGYADSTDRLRRRGHQTWARGVNPRAGLHHMLAVLTQSDRTDALGDLDVPALVVHGMDDRMVHASGGRATARAIPGSALLSLPGMGHDLPPEVQPRLVAAVAALAGHTA